MFNKHFVFKKNGTGIDVHYAKGLSVKGQNSECPISESSTSQKVQVKFLDGTEGEWSIPSKTFRGIKKHMESPCSTKKDYRMGFLLEVYKNPNLTGLSKYRMERKFPGNVIQESAYFEGVRLVVLKKVESVYPSDDEYAWALTDKGKDMVETYLSSKSKDTSCPICDRYMKP